MGVNLLRTFFTRWIQLLRQRVITRWMYPGPSCPDHPFSEELGKAEALAHGANLNSGASPTPLREGIDNTTVSLLTFSFGSLRNLIFSLWSCLPAGSHKCSQRATGGGGFTLPKDAVRREANCTHNKQLWTQRQRR
jgi:hypothetical protein